MTMVTLMIDACLMYVSGDMHVHTIYNTTVIMNSDTHLTGYLYAIKYLK